MTELKAFLVRLATDPQQFAAFIRDPEAVLDNAGLSAEDRATLASADPNRLYAALAPRKGNPSTTNS